MTDIEFRPCLDDEAGKSYWADHRGIVFDVDLVYAQQAGFMLTVTPMHGEVAEVMEELYPKDDAARTVFSTEQEALEEAARRIRQAVEQWEAVPFTRVEFQVGSTTVVISGRTQEERDRVMESLQQALTPEAFVQYVRAYREVHQREDMPPGP